MSHPEQDPITVKAEMPVAILDINQRPAGVGPSQTYLYPNLVKIRLFQISMPLFIPYFFTIFSLAPILIGEYPIQSLIVFCFNVLVIFLFQWPLQE